MALTRDQQAALEACLGGQNIFITGGGGVGKTYLIHTLVENLEEAGRSVILTASTARAARLIGGSTCHHTFRIPIKMAWSQAPDVRPTDAVCAADTVIVDEISMLRMDSFGYLVRCIEAADIIRHKAGLAPIQLIVVGDFFQLPPVIVEPKDGRVGDRDLMDRHYGFDIGDGYAFQAPEWDACKFRVCLLREVVRQSDRAAVDALNRLRCDTSADSLNDVEKLTRKTAYRAGRTDVIHLCGTNATADRINQRALRKLPGPDAVYLSDVFGRVDKDDKPVPDRIVLRRGARIMTTLNTSDYINGSTGTVTFVGSDYIRVRLDDKEEEVDVTYAEWEVTAYVVNGDGHVTQKVIGRYRQLPVLPAYAVTIHRSQGQTLGKAVLCVGNKRAEIFAHGQIYVGLSRVSNLADLYIDGDTSLIKKFANPDVVAFYKSLGCGWEEPVPTEKAAAAKKRTRQKSSTLKTLSGGSRRSEVAIAVPNDLLLDVILSFASVLDPSAHADGSNVYVSSQYADAVSEFNRQF